jgi:hypothetical protein
MSIYARLFEAGEADYAITLRSMAETLQMKLQYLETMRQYNEAVIWLDYLTAKD